MVIIRQCFKGRSNLWEAYFALNVRDEIVFAPQTAAVPAVEVKEGVRQAALERGLESFLSRDIHSLSE